LQARIAPATFLDLSYVAANLCPADQAEISCQVEQYDPLGVAAAALSGYAFTVEAGGNPELAFGAARGRADGTLWIAWSWGTKRSWRALPDAIRFIQQHLQPMVYRDGALRVEARALASNERAHRFLERIGGRCDCALRSYGKGGEDFLLYSWTRDAWETTGS
jgi:hypothetical protein